MKTKTHLQKHLSSQSNYFDVENYNIDVKRINLFVLIKIGHKKLPLIQSHQHSHKLELYAQVLGVDVRLWKLNRLAPYFYLSYYYRPIPKL